MPGLKKSKKAVGPMTPTFIVLYVLAAVVTLVFYLVIQGYAAQSTPALIVENEFEVQQNYITDALITLPNWGQEHMCLAKSEIIAEKEVIYPGLVPSWKLDEMQSKGRIPIDDASRMCLRMPRGTDPHSMTLDWGAIVNDSENTNGWHLNTIETTAEGKNTVERAIAIEYPNGVVHVGKLQLWVCERDCI